MRVALVGATGFLGGAIHAALVDDGHEVVALYHRGAAPRFAPAQWTRGDLATMTMQAWAPLLQGVQVVINCAGVLQDSRWESTAGVHRDGLATLIKACEAAGVARLIYFSAIGADRHTPSAFSSSKREGEEIVRRSSLAWVILRPSVIVGRGAFGGSALFRGLAALPVLPVMPQTGPLQIVQRDDVVRTVMFFLQPGSPAKVALDLAGPQEFSMAQVIALYRAWLGWKPAHEIALRALPGTLLYWLGDFARALGWRPPLGTTARREMAYGATGDSGPWTQTTGIVPRRLEAALLAEPASVQERWFAQLYLLKPAGLAVFSLFWIGTGIVSLTFGFDIGVSLMRQGGAGALSAAAVVAGALADILVGAAIAFRRSARWGLWGGVLLTGFYIVAGTIMTPWLWAQPLGPFVKIFPILVFNLMLLATLEER